MLPDVGGTELILIAAVALIVVGPKDLPLLMRKVGQFVGRMRAMAGEFRASFDDMARQSELDDLRKEIDAMKADRVDPVGWVADTYKGEAVLDWEDPDADLYRPPADELPTAAEPAPVKPKRPRRPAAAKTTAPKAATPRQRAKPAADSEPPAPRRPRKPKAGT